jgi:SAM-dependent methyltransferase
VSAPIVDRHHATGNGGRPRSRDILRVYDAALRRAAAGEPVGLSLCDDRGDAHPVDVEAWCRRFRPGDNGLLDRCAGPTLDVGCGPGRLAGALLGRGQPALGVDVSAAAVALARRRGIAVLRRDVFDPLPGHGRWRHVLLADGNIGIGGAPGRLLRRCRDLLASDGFLHAEVTAPGTRTWAGIAHLREDGDPGVPLRWASVSLDALNGIAAGAHLRVLDARTEAGRWFATLARA